MEESATTKETVEIGEDIEMVESLGEMSMSTEDK
jgi:hypothetical protein